MTAGRFNISKSMVPAAIQLLTMLALLLFYLDRMAPSLTWLDGGELIATSYSLGTSHPSGHPLYMFLAKALSYFLPGNVAFRFNLISVIFAVATLAAARALFIDFMNYLLRDRSDGSFSFELTTQICASGGVLALAFIPAFAFHALRTEIYTLGFLIETLLVWSCLKVLISQTSQRPALLAPIIFFFGLGLCVHNFSAILLFPMCALSIAVIMVEIKKSGGEFKRPFLKAAALFALSLMPLLYGLGRSCAGPYLDFSHIASAGQFLDVFSASIYRDSFIGAGEPFNFTENLRHTWALSGAHILPASMILAVGGAAALLKRAKLIFLSIVLGTAVPLLGLLTQSELYPDNPDHSAYIFPSILLIVLLAAAAVRWAGELPFVRKAREKPLLSSRFICAFIALSIFIFQSLSEAKIISMKESCGAGRHADLLDMILPADAIIFLNNDEVSFPILYMQVAEKRRLDITPSVYLQYNDENAYGVARKYWKEKLPPAEKMQLGYSVRTDPQKGSILLDAIVNYAEDRFPLVWDYMDGSTIKIDYLVPYYHLALIVPPGKEGPVLKRSSGGQEKDLARAFHEFFISMKMEEIDLFPLKRLARRPLAVTGIIHYRKENPVGAIVADSLALGFSPQEPEILYNRGLAFEVTGQHQRALADFMESAKLGGENKNVKDAIQRVKRKINSGEP